MTQKLDVLQTISMSFVQSARIARRHIHWLLLTALALLAVDILKIATSAASVQFISALACAPIAIFTHQQLIRGKSGVGDVFANSQLMTRYAIEASICFTIPAVILAVIVVSLASAVGYRYISPFLSETLFFIAIIAISARPALKLPARAVGDSLTWKEACRLGRGNTISIVLALCGSTLIASAATIVIKAAMKLGMPSLVGLVLFELAEAWGLVFVIGTLSICYRELRLTKLAEPSDQPA